MATLSALRLRVQEPKKLCVFYVEKLGMTARPDPDGMRVGYHGPDADLLLQPGGLPYQHSGEDRYWKIGLCLPNLDIAVAQLRAAGIEVTTPRQFLDIGYMCHLTDPAGFVIELLQEDFEGDRPKNAGDTALPLGGGAHLGQITLRTGDMATELEFYEELGMQQLSKQPVPTHGFQLYFLADTDETRPDPDLTAIRNRPWLWKRPYSVLEFQHKPGLKPHHTPALEGLEISGLVRDQIDPAGMSVLPC